MGRKVVSIEAANRSTARFICLATFVAMESRNANSLFSKALFPVLEGRLPYRFEGRCRHITWLLQRSEMKTPQRRRAAKVMRKKLRVRAAPYSTIWSSVKCSQNWRLAKSAISFALNICASDVCAATTSSENARWRQVAAWKAATKGDPIITCFTIIKYRSPEIVSKNPIEVETLTAAQLRRLWPLKEAYLSLRCTWMSCMHVVVCYGGPKVTVYAILDCGSTASFCNRKLMKIFQVTGHPKLLTVNTLTHSKKLDSIAIKVPVRAVTLQNQSNPLKTRVTA